MQDYHHAWLSAHTDRTEAWLRDRLADGFEVHHIDGVRANNAPLNLVLIEHKDHARLHQCSPDLRAMLPRRRTEERLTRINAEGRVAYEHRLATGGWAGQRNAAKAWARWYAIEHSLPWPPARV